MDEKKMEPGVYSETLVDGVPLSQLTREQLKKLKEMPGADVQISTGGLGENTVTVVRNSIVLPKKKT